MLPTLLSTPIEVPALLIPPHVFYLILFATAILIEIWALLFKRAQASAKHNAKKKEIG
jgi:hypothetical protein